MTKSLDVEKKYKRPLLGTMRSLVFKLKVDMVIKMFLFVELVFIFLSYISSYRFLFCCRS